MSFGRATKACVIDVASRRALISKDDLDRMATAVASHGVVLKGRVDPMGGFTFTMTPQPEAGASNGRDDFDSRFDDWAAS